MDAKHIEDLKRAIREIPDWPKKGILFYDVTTLLKQGQYFEQTINALLEPYKESRIELVFHRLHTGRWRYRELHGTRRGCGGQPQRFFSSLFRHHPRHHRLSLSNGARRMVPICR